MVKKTSKKIELVVLSPFQKSIKGAGLKGIAKYLRGTGDLSAEDREFIAHVIERLSRRLDSRRKRDREYETMRKDARGGTDSSGRMKWSAAYRLLQAQTMIDAIKLHGHTSKEAHERTAAYFNDLNGAEIYKNGESLRKAIADRKNRLNRKK